MKLRVDPWDPEYGASVEFDGDLGPPAGLDLGVETSGDWAPVALTSGIEAAGYCAFVDGVRRIDCRLFAEEGDAATPALAGSWAVGAAWSTLPPRISDVRVGRELVVGGGMQALPLEVRIGTSKTIFIPRSVAGATPADPVQGLQNGMRDAEAALAEGLLAGGEADLVVSDGPLTYFASGAAVGMVKRQSRTYLDVDRARVLARLDVGQRSPMFKFGEQRLERYSWYLRLASRRPIDGAAAGLVRLEVAAFDGIDSARAVAGLTQATLPRFAPAPGRDARAPQNLHPIAALEGRLRHRLGDLALIRRALETTIHEEVVHGR